MQEFTDLGGRLDIIRIKGNRGSLIVVVVCSGGRWKPTLAALARQTRSSGWRKKITFSLQQLCMLSLPRTDLGAECVTDFVSGGDGRDFLPHAILELEEPAARIMNDGNNGLGHLHLFLLAGGNVVTMGKISQNLLKVSVAGVACTNSGLATENIFLGWLFDANGFMVDLAGVVLAAASWRGLAFFLWLGSQQLFRLHGNVSW